MSEHAILSEASECAEIHEVHNELGRLLASRQVQASSYASSLGDLWKLAADHMVGGKLLRPRLLLGAFEALGGIAGAAPRAAAVRIAAGVELLHYSFLLHDDVIDGDLLRRGRPNLIGTVLRERDSAAQGGDFRRLSLLGTRELHWAQTCALLIGDMLLAFAHDVFAREQLPSRMRLQLLDLLDRTIAESVSGELLDVGLSDGVVPSEPDVVLEMTRTKTATYTFELPLRAAAILANASVETQEILGEVGKVLGSAFQLQDDLFSTFGLAEEHGKDAFSDLREGKETAIIAYARRTDVWPMIDPHFGLGDMDDQEGERMRALLVGCGAERFVRSLLESDLRACREIVSAAEGSISDELMRFLRNLVDTIQERQS